MVDFFEEAGDFPHTLPDLVVRVPLEIQVGGGGIAIGPAHLGRVVLTLEQGELV
jgi:hypothetical protein